MRITAILLVLILSIPTDACVWVKGTTKHGSSARVSGISVAHHLRLQLRRSIETDLKAEGEAMMRSLRHATSFDDRNDYAVALLYLGRANDAIALLQKLEVERTGDYAVASNLGTAYELASQNQNAKKWIEEAMRRNPDSHRGTEWLHVKILEAKIQHERDPSYFSHHSVLNLDYRSLETGAKTILVGGGSREVRQVRDALQYQLEERLKFIKTSDPVVASLIFDYAAIEAGTGTLESARGLLEMAAEYSYPIDRIKPLLERYAAIIRWARIKRYLYITGAILASIAAVIYGVKRRWIVYRRQQPSLRTAAS
jgi:tetratricopeptide (TPR) repeat protein